ncbi:MAG TPA: AMP phosphorylase [Candidatus Thermoplasmatota archaeon]|nr:AMP phosphorylase [Candidatus Thermoplasmatota archaeon]
MKLKMRLLDFDLGSHEIFLNAGDADRYGLKALDRVVLLPNGNGEGVSSIVKIAHGSIPPGFVGIGKEQCEHFEAKEGADVTILPATRPKSVEYIRKKLDGKTLKGEEIRAIIEDIAKGNLTDIELTAYACATYTYDMNIDEIVACIEAMVDTGERITFTRGPVLDVHSIGGVPGNKYAPITVSIVAANGLMIPKTSSRAISSACGTADFMEVVSPVVFPAEAIKRMTEQVGGTLCWGGGVNLAPADDAIIRVEYPLSIDPHAQLLASVLAKKKAGGAQFVVIEMPTGEGAKVESEEKARALARDFIAVGERIGIKVQCAITYGGQPIGRAIGPVLEIKEAMQVLEGSENPTSLIEKACSLAGILLELGGAAAKGEGYLLARETLRSGKALKKFREIIGAQGGDPNLKSESLKPGPYHFDVKAIQHGYVESIANKKLNRIARAAGSPRDKGAGLYLHLKKGRRVEIGEPIYTIYAEHEHKLKEAVALANQLNPFQIEGMVIEEVVE